MLRPALAAFLVAPTLSLGLPAHGAAKASSITLAVTRPAAVAGDRVTLHGRVTPAQAGVRVLIERRGVVVLRARTGVRGRYTARMRVGRSGVWSARIAGTSVRSAAVRITASPQLRIEVWSASAFVGAQVVVHARPRTTGRVELTILRLGEPVAEVRVPIGRRVVVPTDALGRFALRAELGASVARARVTAVARTLSYGSTGRDVLALRARLARLRVHVPGPSTTFGSELFDSVVAFQKARGLSRTGVADEATWRALSRELVPAPRRRGTGTHIEVSKSRQILLIVENGRTASYLPVSSGAGGITPVGNFSVLWKAPSTSTWLGSAILYRTMTIHGNVAIHGYPSVPTYPASHGCIRVPIWIADWLYGQTPVGEPVYVYE